MAELRVVKADAPTWRNTVAVILRAFGQPVPSGDSGRDGLRPESRRLALLSGDQVVGGCFAYDVALKLPGAATVPAAALAGVGIEPSIQGQGGLKKLLRSHLCNSCEHGDIVSLLMASESGLYGQFGYAPATELAEYKLDTAQYSLRSPVKDSGRIELIEDLELARALCSEVHSAQSLAGEMQRSADWWQHVISNGERNWIGGGPQFVAVHRDDAGAADGYALYVLEEMAPGESWGDGNQRMRLMLRELVTLNHQAEVALFCFLCGIAWVRELRWLLAPVDPPIKHFMRDPRQLVQVTRIDMLWIRILDMQKLFAACRFHRDGKLSFEYQDELLPENIGKYQLTVVDGEPDVKRLPMDSETDIQLRPEHLAATILGGTRVACLYQLGAISGNERGMRVLDSILLSDRPPFNISKF